MALPQYAGIFKHKFRGEYPNKSCVYRIWAGEKFFIWKCQALHNSMYHLCGVTERKIRLGVKPDDLFCNFIAHIINAEIKEVEAEVLFLSDEPFEMLKYEHDLLKSEKHNPLCLNASFVPYIPGWMQSATDQYNKWKQCL